MRYFVSYTANSPEGNVYGMTEVNTDQPIYDMQRLVKITERIKETSTKTLTDVMIIYWRRFEQP